MSRETGHFFIKQILKAIDKDFANMIDILDNDWNMGRLAFIALNCQPIPMFILYS